MADTMIGGGSGGSMVIMLRVLGISGTTIRATCDSNTVSGTIGSTGYLYLKLKTLGVWSVTTSKNGYSFTQDVKIFRYGITECWALAKKSFADCTPAEIQAVAKAGLCKDFWRIGDRKAVQMMNGEYIYLRVYDFDHDVGTDGATTLPLTLGMEDCFKTTRNMNPSGTNVGGWANCQFRTNTLPSLKENFPDEWQQIMTKCQKKTSAGNKSNVIQTTDDDLFLFSEVELFGDTTTSFAGEGKLYRIFTDNGSRVKRVNGVASMFWGRSPLYGTETGFSGVTSDGTVIGYNASTRGGVALGFCVG